MKLFHRHFCIEASPILAVLFSLLLLTALVAPAAATPVTWNLNGVSFADGGGATGWFTFDESLYSVNPKSAITEWNVTATLGSIPPDFYNPHTFNSFIAWAWMTETTSSVSFVDVPLGYDPVLQLALTEPLSKGTGSIPIAITEGSFFSLAPYVPSIPNASSRIVSGELVASSVPEPATLLLLGAGLVGVIGLRRKWKK